MMGSRPLGRTLVTGAGGFLGVAVVARLRRAGEAVLATDVVVAPHGVVDAACDVTIAERVDAVVRDGGFGTILHCGAVSGPMVMADRPLDVWRINAGGTVRVLEAARRHGVGRTVLCSTTEVYGSVTGTVDESTLPAPRSVYAASKVAGEQAMLGYGREHGVDAVALRLSWIYGPGRNTPTTLETLLRRSTSGEPSALEGGEADVTHYLYIDDAVDAVLAAARAESPEERILDATAGPGVPMGRVADVVRRSIPSARIAFAGGREPAGGPSVIDSARAEATIGFKAAVSLETGIARYLEALRGR